MDNENVPSARPPDRPSPLENLSVPGPGTYDIVNALVHSNGSLLVRADSATQIVPRVQGYVEGWV
jgi:hypothetical protein